MSTPPRRRPARPVGRVLLIHPGALGDLVQALPAFGAVRAGYPDAHVTLLTDAGLADLARGTRLFDEVIGFDAPLAYHGSPGARVGLFARLALRVRRAAPDVAAVFKGAIVYGLLAALSGARQRAGLARGVGRRALTHPVPIDPARHHEDRFLEVVAALGLDVQYRTDPAWPAVPDLVTEQLPERVHPLIGLAPGGARNAKQDLPVKRWPADRFAALARALAAAHPHAAFVLLGASGDRAEVDAVRAALADARVVDLAGRTDVAGARAAIATLDVFVGNDSGLMHVAATTDTPTVVAFGPTDPRVLAPRAPGVRAVWVPAPNPPCYDEVTGAMRSCAVPCCIERVTVAQMLAAVQAALGVNS